MKAEGAVVGLGCPGLRGAAGPTGQADTGRQLPSHGVGRPAFVCLSPPREGRSRAPATPFPILPSGTPVPPASPHQSEFSSIPECERATGAPDSQGCDLSQGGGPSCRTQIPFKKRRERRLPREPVPEGGALFTLADTSRRSVVKSGPSPPFPRPLSEAHGQSQVHSSQDTSGLSLKDTVCLPSRSLGFFIVG